MRSGKSSNRESVSEEVSQRTRRLHKQLSILSIGSGVVEMCQDLEFDKLLHGAKPDDSKLGSPPKTQVPTLTGAFFSPSSSSKKLDMSAQKSQESPVAPASP